MDAQRLYRGRLIDHLQLVVADIAAARRFYDAIFDVLGVPLGGEIGTSFWYDELFVSTPDSPEAAGMLTGRIHLAFQAKDRAMVDAFYRAGLSAGGVDNGAPGVREQYHRDYYGAFLVDPAGNNIEAAHHGPSERSADSVEVSFEG